VPLKETSINLGQAMDHFDFYINHAGVSLAPEDKEHLEKVKQLLRQLFSE